MDNDLSEILRRSVEMELLVGDLYLIFHENFPEDAAFWWKLTLEENHHAALLKSGMEYFHAIDKFPEDLLPDSLEGIKNTNAKLQAMVERYRLVPPSRERAFNVAYIIETSAGELHFQTFFDKEELGKGGELFRKLNRDDIDHARRIREYMEQNGIRYYETHTF